MPEYRGHAVTSFSTGTLLNLHQDERLHVGVSHSVRKIYLSWSDGPTATCFYTWTCEQPPTHLTAALCLRQGIKPRTGLADKGQVPEHSR